MRRTLQQLWTSPWLRGAVMLVVAVAAVWFVLISLKVWFVIVAAFVLSYLLYPVMAWSQRVLHARWLGIVFFGIGLLILLGLFALLVVNVVHQLGDLPRQLPHLFELASSSSQGIPGFLRRLPLPDVVRTQIVDAYGSGSHGLDGLVQELADKLAAYVSGGGLFATVRAVFSDLVLLFGFLAMTLYLLLDFPRINRNLLRLTPLPYQDIVRDVLEKFEHSVGGYFRGQLVIAAVIGVLTGGGLMLLHVPLALSLGFLAGVFNLIPYFGPIISGVPALLMGATQGWWTVLAVLGIWTLANQLEGHVLSPVILGRAERLNPATMVMVLLLGVHLFGLVGALLAVPVASFLKLLVNDYYLPSRLHGGG